jgi:FixJ family two-component response regulator
MPLAGALEIPLMTRMPDEAMADQIRAAKIALVDDDPSVRRGVSRLLRSRGFLCTTFESGEAALAALDSNRTDCLILDVNLTGIDGFETRDRLEAGGLKIPVIFITALLGINSYELRTRLHGSPCLGKPFEESELIGAIRSILGN